jgi:Uncharacterized conserved protein (DUF2285)
MWGQRHFLIFEVHKTCRPPRSASTKIAQVQLAFAEGFSVTGVHAVPPLNHKVAELAPDEPALTSYDEQHAVTYVRLLDAEADNADWREVARIVLQIDPTLDPDRARRTFDSHLARAKWVARHGYRDLLQRGWPKSEG